MHINAISFEMLLQKRRWTQVELARQSGVAPKTIGRIKLGQEVRRTTAERIAKAIGVSLEVLQNPPTDALINDAAKKGGTERLVLDVAASTLNDLWLASRHYNVSINDVVRFAPLLFMIVADRSLQRRREHLEEWFARCKSLGNEHPVNGDIQLELNSINDNVYDIYRTEIESIEARELSAGLQEEYSTEHDGHRHPFFETIEEMARGGSINFIESRIDDCLWTYDGRWAALDEIIPHVSRFPEEAARCAVEFGNVLLRDLPEELLPSNRTEDRIAWLASFYGGAKGNLETARALFEGPADEDEDETSDADNENA